MSVRPRQVAEEAHKFSLRTVFGTFDKAFAEDEPPTTTFAQPLHTTATPTAATASSVAAESRAANSLAGRSFW